MLSKGLAYEVFAHQWKAAIELLARARYVFVVGYSFPTTDAFMKRLLSDALKDNDNLLQLCIVDIQPLEQWQARLNELFNPLFLDNRVTFVQSRAANFFAGISETPNIDNWPMVVRQLPLP